MPDGGITVEGNGWNEWSRHVLSELKRLNDGHQETNDKVEKILVQMAGLQTEMKLKAGIVGLIGGAIPVVITIAIYLITKGGV